MIPKSSLAFLGKTVAQIHNCRVHFATIAWLRRAVSFRVLPWSFFIDNMAKIGKNNKDIIKGAVPYQIYWGGETSWNEARYTVMTALQILFIIYA